MSRASRSNPSSKLITQLLIPIFLLGLSACIQTTGMLHRATTSQLQKYERDERPKDVLKWIFRDEKKVPDVESLIVLHDWSKENRWLFIKLLDKLDGEWRVAFVDAYAGMLVDKGLENDFLTQFKESDSKSFIELRAAITKAQ